MENTPKPQAVTPKGTDWAKFFFFMTLLGGGMGYFLLMISLEDRSSNIAWLILFIGIWFTMLLFFSRRIRTSEEANDSGTPPGDSHN